MTKRDAADYITRDNKGAMSAPPDRVPRAATAAQMAQRKLKAPRGRLNSAVPSNGSPYTSASSSFGQIGSGNNQPSTPFGNNTNSGASSFTTSASFPPQQPSNLNFNPALPSGPFTFGASATSNPFSGLGANLGNTGSSSSNNINFRGFGSHTSVQTNPQSDADTMMESPQKKPPAFGAGFGTGSASTPSAAAFAFGQSSQSIAPSGFGLSATTQPSNDSFKYGQSLPAAQPGNTFGFAGQRSEDPKPQASLFGQSTNNSQPVTNLFTRPASTAPSSSSLFSQRAPAFNSSSNLFGQTPATTLPPGNNFGGSVPSTQSSNGGPQGTWFGNAPAAANPATDTHTSPEASKPSFGLAPTRPHPSFASPAAPATNANRVMSNMAPDLTPLSSPSDSVGPVFSGGSTLFSGGSDSTFGDVFKANANARLASANTTTVPKESSLAKPDPFTSKPTNSSMQTSSSNTARLLGTKSSESDTRGGLFGRVLRPEESVATSGSPADDEHEPSSEKYNSANTTSLFGKAFESEPISRPLIEPTKARETSSQFPKGPQHQLSTLQSLPSSIPSASNSTPPTTQQAKQPPSSASKGLLFTKTSAPSSHDATSKPIDFQAKQASWHAPNATSSPAKTNLGSNITPSTSSKAPAAPQSFPLKSNGSASASSESDIRLRSYGSSAIPGYLDSDESVEHDSLSRLRNLNASFQKKVAKLDPAADDFEEIVRHYVAQCAHIGHALNLKEREKAGMKRKMDNSEENDETLKGSKKARIEDFSSESTEAGTPPFATINSSTSASIQPPKTVTTQPIVQQTGLGGNIGLSTATSGVCKATISTPARASSAFTSMSAASNPPSNPFAGLTASAPSSNKVKPRAQPAAPDAGTVNGTAQYSNPFASLGANASIAPVSVSDATSTTPFKPEAPSTTPARSPPKKVAFEVPKFGASSGASFMDAFAEKSAKSAADFEEEAKRKRKAEDFDSDEDDEAEWERKYEDEQRAKRNKLESLSQGGKTGFQPLFFNKDTSATAKKFFNLATDKVPPDSSSAPESTNSSTGSIGFTSADTVENGFGGSLNSGDGESSGSRRSEEHGESPSQEDSDQGTDEDNEEDLSDGDQDQDEHHEDVEEEDAYNDESEDEDIQAAMARSKSKGSLFDRIEPNPNLKPTDTTVNGAPNAQQKPNGMSLYSTEVKATPNAPKASQAAVNSSFKSFGSNGVLNSGVSTSTPDAPTMSPFTPINGSGSDTKDPFAPAGSVFANSKKPEIESASIPKKANGEKFSFGSNTSVSAPTPARSVLFGASVSLGASTIPGEGLFGSRPSTPSNDEPSRGSVFSSLGSGPSLSNSKGDNTYKQGTPIKFGTPNKDGPTFNITAATPPAKDDPPAASKSFPSLFGPKPSKPGAEAVANVGFNFGGPTHLTASPLLGASALSSAVSSRATSPGATDTESVNTDTAEDNIEEPQASLMSTRPGEEDEDVLFEARSKALKFIRDAEPNGEKPASKFETQGVGQLRVLKHKITGKTRLLLRTEPGSNIVLNTALIPSLTYRETGGRESGGVKFGVPTRTGIEQWVAKLKTSAMAEELAGILEANKGDRTQE